MKKTAISILISFSCCILSAQGVAINNDNSSPAASAMLDVKSTTAGVLIPRITSVQRTSISSPADGLLVFDLTTNTFWYYDLDATAWSELTGTTGGTCSTLEEAYNCGGSGAGKSITVDYGALSFTTTSGATNNDVILIATNKGSAVTPGSGISVTHTAYGVGLYAEITKNNTQYSAVQGIVTSANTNSSTTSFPAGVSGYYDGTGIGIGVWGESVGNGSIAGAGVYGLGSNKNFGGYFQSNTYPGISCLTNSSTAQSLQVSSASSSYTNPAAIFRGSVQFDVSSNASCQSILFNNLSGEPTISPQAADYGFLGTAAYYWYVIYANNLINVSRRELKRDITSLDDKLGNFVLQDIENMKPSFYKYKIETDEVNSENPTKYRPNMHLGIILDEAPDYLQDNAFSGIDVYALATLSLAGVQQVYKKVKVLEQTITDFGIAKVTTQEVYISFNDEFSGKLKESDIPVVTVTPNLKNVQVSIQNQDKHGFTIVFNQDLDKEVLINWIAMAKVTNTEIINYSESIDPILIDQLIVPADIKTNSRKLFNNEQEKPMELLSPDLNGRPAN